MDVRLSVDEELLVTAGLCIGRRFGLLRFVVWWCLAGWPNDGDGSLNGISSRMDLVGDGAIAVYYFVEKENTIEFCLMF